MSELGDSTITVLIALFTAAVTCGTFVYTISRSLTTRFNRVEDKNEKAYGRIEKRLRELELKVAENKPLSSDEVRTIANEVVNAGLYKQSKH